MLAGSRHRCLDIHVLSALANDIAAHVGDVDAAGRNFILADAGFRMGLLDVGCHDGRHDAAFRSANDSGVCQNLQATLPNRLLVQLAVYLGLSVGLAWIQHRSDATPMAIAWIAFLVPDDGKPE